jgi:hypothetical protein
MQHGCCNILHHAQPVKTLFRLGVQPASLTLSEPAPTPLGHLSPFAPTPGRLTADHGRRLPGSPPRPRPGGSRSWITEHLRQRCRRTRHGSPSTCADLAGGPDADHRARPRRRTRSRYRSTRRPVTCPARPPRLTPGARSPAGILRAGLPSAGTSAPAPLRHHARATGSLAFVIALGGSLLRDERRDGFLLGSRPILASEGGSAGRRGRWGGL